MSADEVLKKAREEGVHPIEALVESGHIDPLTEATTEELVAELKRRMNDGEKVKDEHPGKKLFQ